MKNIKIGSFKVKEGGEPFLIAELSGNHDGSLKRAREIIKLVSDAGFHAIKLQTYTADTMTLNLSSGPFYISDKNSLWAGSTLYELYKKAATPWEWHEELFSYARSLGLEAFSTPFDESAVDFLETLNVPCYKVASFEITHLPLIKKIAKTGKPLILSTGMATAEEIDQAIQVVQEEGNEQCILLKCTSSYPAKNEHLNLATILDMKNRYNCLVGYSDHTSDFLAAALSVGLGATVIEKHVTLEVGDGAVDAAFSLGSENCSLFIQAVKSAYAALGKIFYGPTDAEKPSLVYRRSVHVVRPIKKGETITHNDLKVVRPAVGLEPKYFDLIIGKKASRDLIIGEFFDFQDVI